CAGGFRNGVEVAFVFIAVAGLMHKLLQSVVQRGADGLLIAVVVCGLLAATRVNNAAGQVPLMVGVHHLADIGDADAFQFVVAVVAVLVSGAFGRGVAF